MTDRRCIIRVMTGVASVLLINALAIPAVAQGLLADAVLPGRSLGQFVVEPDQLPAPAELAPPPPALGDYLSSLSLGASTWISFGNSDSNFGGGLGPLGFVNPLSDLKWSKMVSETAEFNVSALFFNKVIVNADLGAGYINSGNLTDSDFAGSGGANLFSQSLVPAVPDKIDYFNIELGWRFYESPDFAFDMLGGYQFWRERYLGEGGVQVVSAPGFGVPPAGSAFPATPVVSEQYTWQGFRVGFQSILDIIPNLSVKARLMVMPVTQFENDDIHFIRVPVLTATERATGGFGIMADIRASWWLWRGLYVEGGYRVWDAQSGSGQAFESVGTTAFSLPFNQATTLRQGVIVGLSYEW